MIIKFSPDLLAFLYIKKNELHMEDVLGFKKVKKRIIQAL